MKPIKAEYDGEQVTIVKLMPINALLNDDIPVVFINSAGNLDWAYVTNIRTGVTFTNCHYEDEFIPLDRIGTTR